MMDYYGSIIQSKEQIYKDIISRYPTYTKDYISSKIDYLYETEFISEEVSVSGWMVFVGSEIIKEIYKMIDIDLQKSKQRLLLAQWLVPQEDISLDIIEEISKKII
jgi:hypothetical protein